MIRYCLAATGLMAAIVLAAPAQSQVVLGINDVSLETYNGNVKCIPRNGCSLGGESWSPGYNVFENDGDSWAFDFGALWVNGGIGGDKNAGVSVDFDFFPEGSIGDSGAGKYATAFGIVTGGVLKWDSNQEGADGLVFMAGGAQFQLTLDDIRGVEWGSSATLRGSIMMLSHVTDPPDEQNPGGVPEPASWAMTLAGFAIVGGTLRARRRTTIRFA